MNRLNGIPATALIEPPAHPTITVIRARPGPSFEAVLEVRRRVFSDEQGMVDGRVTDQDDGRGVHALAYRELAGRSEPVGTGRLILGAGDRGEALISWVATLPEARRHGVGREIMRFLIDWAEASGASLVALAAQTHAELFYRKLGFVGTGRVYCVRGVEHRWMVRRNYRPALRQSG
ncbi:MAG: GNAT family N-acetyltransferase [Chloroflexota bacterium]|nr:GNAT family N-acetyltransferase [Chloroflexota bacterium]